MLQKHHGLTCGCRHLTVLSQEAKLGPLDLPKFNMEPRKLAVACWDMLSLGGVPLQFLKKTIDYPPQKKQTCRLMFHAVSKHPTNHCGSRKSEALSLSIHTMHQAQEMCVPSWGPWGLRHEPFVKHVGVMGRIGPLGATWPQQSLTIINNRDMIMETTDPWVTVSQDS